MGVLFPQQLAERVSIAAANLDVQAGKVRDALGRWSPPPIKVDGKEAPGPMRGAKVLIVAATLDEADQLAAKLRDTAAEFTTVGTHGTLAGRAFDVVVYRPGWRGAKTAHPAADQWRTAIVKTRQIHPGVELYL